MLEMIAQRVFLHQGTITDIMSGEEYAPFRFVVCAQYVFNTEQLNPPNMSSVVDFIQQLEDKLKSNAKNVLICLDEGKKPLTDAVFLLGAYMILKADMTMSQVIDKFAWLSSSDLEPYHNVSPCATEIPLQVFDCLRGLEKGKLLGWVQYAESGYMWGETDMEQYRHYSSVANGFLHQVVPGKFIAFPGPQDMVGRNFYDRPDGGRVFSPAYYAKVLSGMKATDVIQLHKAEYDRDGFTSLGLRHHVMEFEDGACPPDGVIAAFFRTVDAAEGPVAVHCRAGLGRTGTLIALYLMRSYGFGALEAMGWLRIMRPGSVIGPQQRYLWRIEVAVTVARSLRDGLVGTEGKATGSGAGAAATGGEPIPCS
jgi:cell division cycle 14